MKTVLPTQITTVDEAKAFLTDLHNNGEAFFHPEDDITEYGGYGNETGQLLNRLMDDMHKLEGFDACEFLLKLVPPACICRCRKCDTVLIDRHAPAAAKRIQIPNDAKEMTRNGFGELGCPVCLTDGHLSDF